MTSDRCELSDGPVGGARRLVDRRVHRGRRPGVRGADPAAGRRGAGRRRRACSTSAAATARSAGWRRRSAPTSSSASTRRGTRSASPPSAAAVRRSPAAEAAALPFADASRSTPSSPASCSSTSRRRRGDRRGRPGARSPAAGSASSSTIRCCRRPNSGWIDDQVLDPPEQYWRIGAVPRRGTRRSRRSRRTCSSRFIHRPLSRYVNALAEQRAADRADARACAAGRLPRARAASTPTRRPSRGCCTSEPAQARLGNTIVSAMADIVLITGLSGAGRSARGRRAGGPRLVRRRQPADVAGREDRRAGQQAGQRHRAHWHRSLALVAGRDTSRCSRQVAALRAERPPGAPCSSSTPRPPELVRRYDATAGASTRSPPRPTACVEAIELERELLEPVTRAPPIW